jgi:uncharacterized protein involved in exopolysaccharide biosynthesis
MGPIYSLEDAIDMVRRHAMAIFIVTVLGTVVSFFLALSQTHQYQAFEVIQIESPRIAEDLASSSVQGSSARRLQLVQQQITTRGAMLEIIEKHDLFGAQSALRDSEKVTLLRDAVAITGIAAAREGFSDDGTISVLTITVTLPSPEQAQAVAREFSSRTIELYAARRIDEAAETLAFLRAQEDEIAAQVRSLEIEIADYRAGQEIARPGTLDFQRSQIATLSSAILDIDREKISVQRQIDQLDGSTARQSTVERELSALQVQLDSLDAQRALLSQQVAQLTESIETSPEVERRLRAYERDLDQLQEQLELITARRAEAEVGYRLEIDRQSERLVVIEPASLPDYPITPSRKRNAILGMAASFIAGLGIAFLLALRRPVLRTADQMERETGISPVISIPEVTLRKRGKPEGNLVRRLTRRLRPKNAPAAIEPPGRAS